MQQNQYLGFAGILASKAPDVTFETVRCPLKNPKPGLGVLLGSSIEVSAVRSSSSPHPSLNYRYIWCTFASTSKQNAKNTLAQTG